MGYGCIICDECLELPAPDYTPDDEATLEECCAGPSAGAPRTRARKTTSPRKRKGNIRDGTPTDVIVTPCGHLFHQTCIARWFKDKNSMNCPACRKLCNQSKLIRMFPTVVLYHPAIDDGFNYKPIENKSKTSTETPLLSTDPFAMPLVQVGPRTSMVEMQNPQVIPQNPRPHCSGHRLPTSTVTVPNESQSSVAQVPKPMTLGPCFVDCGMEIIRNTTLVAQAAANSNYYNNLDNNDSDGDDPDQAPVVIGVIGQPTLEQPRPLECARPSCQDLRVIHQTLIQDFEDVQNKYSDALEDLTMKQAQEQSYDDMIKSQIDAMDSLRGERDELKEKLVESTNAINTVKLHLNNIQNGFNGLKRSTSGNTGIENEEEVYPTKRFRNNENDDNPPTNGKSSN